MSVLHLNWLNIVTPGALVSEKSTLKIKSHALRVFLRVFWCMTTLGSLDWNVIRECSPLPLMQVNKFGMRTVNGHHFVFIYNSMLTCIV